MRRIHREGLATPATDYSDYSQVHSFLRFVFKTQYIRCARLATVLTLSEMRS